jgi:isopenicillin N synthase-like dioxygenase
MDSLPVIDITPLRDGDGAARHDVARAIDLACRDLGFFYIVGHGINDALQDQLEVAARQFFALAEEEKAAIAMEHGGRAWRGWFPVAGELTSGVPDRKEGIYFGAELGPDHPRVRAGVALHGANLFPAHPPELRDTVLAYLDAMTELGHLLAQGVALALGLDAGWFADHLTTDPTILFRIFHYPPAESWGVGEHTDYGLLTILRQDHTGGLEVRTPAGWITAPPVPGAMVCNLGDMLERMTGGRYRSTPHRVRNATGAGRVSFAFFFDPAWDAEVLPVPDVVSAAGDVSSPPAPPRWDGTDVFAFTGTYGDYLLAKVAKVFPDLGRDVL